MREKVNIKEKLGLFHELWSPRIIGELNGQYVKLAKVKGEIVWHSHRNEDEMFLVIKGKLTIRMKDRTNVHLSEGEMFIVPQGVEHQPVAEAECHLLLFEPKSTAHTGEVISKMTNNAQEWI
ncbi:MAG: cupin domain-containing protein [Fulvivirga sp.]|nr:cupin domain-containing protein [Fulvivirga sp.]